MNDGLNCEDGPQVVEVLAGAGSGSEGLGLGLGKQAVAGFQSWFIKDILERADLFNFNSKDGHLINKKASASTTEGSLSLSSSTVVKDAASPTRVVGPEAAFLGPKIWKNEISLPLEDENSADEDEVAPAGEFAIMNLEEFFNENNFELDRLPLPSNDDILGMTVISAAASSANDDHDNINDDDDDEDDDDDDDDVVDAGRIMASRRVSSISAEDSCSTMDTTEEMAEGFLASSNKAKNGLPKGGNDFLYAESKRAKAEKERIERRKRKLEVQVEFSPDELALATIPGVDFDPRRRQFSADELRPQPIIRKRKKTYVASDNKDDKYWERRQKNNVAARRSREARRLKENQIALRTAFLEKENSTLVGELRKSQMAQDLLVAENKALKEKLAKLQQ